jgi:uncharacterized membrane protein
MASDSPSVERDFVPLRSELTRPRLDSVDALRGIVMILMALDHTRGFFSNATFDPLNLAQTNPALFLTRWITHYCAPVFVFLAGTGAFLSTTRGKTKSELSWFLVTRGLWLVILELTVIKWTGWAFNFDLHSYGAAVIWAIGWSMVVLAGLVFLPVRFIALFGIVMIAVHNLFDYVRPADWGSFRWLWVILHQGREGIEFLPRYTLGIGYPLIPWIGVMAAGYAFGTILLRESNQRRKLIFGLGIALTLLFVLLRVSNVYGNPSPWSQQKTPLFTLFSILHCEKYPPSLLYLLMTLGPALIVLSILDRGVPRLFQPVLVFGRVPLFYYLLHLPLIHGLAVVFAYARHGHAHGLYGTPGPRPDGYGYSLPLVYLIWIAVIVILYPVCRWFADLKRCRRDAWLSYF